MKTKPQIEAFALGMIYAFEQENKFEDEQVLTFMATDKDYYWKIDYSYINKIVNGVEEKATEAFEHERSFKWLKTESINRLAKNIQEVIEECYNSEISRC